VAVEIGGLYQEVPAIRDQTLNLGEHALRQFGIARSEGNDDRFWIFAEQPEDELLERCLHWRADLVEFDCSGNAHRVQFGIRLSAVMHNHLARVFLGTAD
jgi:hypothetical protein